MWEAKQLMKSLNTKIRGVTLLESLLVTAIIALGVVLGIQQYQKIVLQRNVARIKNSVQLLTNALQQYYYTNCYYFLADPKSYSIVYPIKPNSNPAVIPIPVDAPPLPTLMTYITQPQLITNPYLPTVAGLNAYQYTIDVRKDFPLIHVSTTFAVSKDKLTTLAALLKPTSIHGTIFTWSMSPGSIPVAAGPLNTNLSYIQTLAVNYTNTSSGNEQVAYQYVNNSSSSTNLCAYWSYPKFRCLVTGNTSRCGFLNAS